MWPLLSAAVAVAVVLIWAEEHHRWFAAQACLITILLLSAMMVWSWWSGNRKPPPLSVEAAAYNRAIHKLLFCVAIGLAAVILNATRWDHWQDGLVARALGYGTLVAGAFFVSGVLIGYLFGLRPAGISHGQVAQSNERVSPHTNLEEIADWLTKLILGAGLVELTNLRAPISQFATFVASGVDPFPRQQSGPQSSPAIALAIMCFFSGSGLLYGYLWTRYELAAVSDTSGIDSSALALVDRWLNQLTMSSDQDRVEMMSAVRSASSTANMQIFQRVEQYRKPNTQGVNDRSLAVFEALVDADSQGAFHRTRAEYALALMGRTRDPRNPDSDWNRAVNLLNDAIEIRDRCGEKGWQAYELARAICQIRLDPNFKKAQPSNAEQKQAILADLDKAKDVAEEVSAVIDKDHVIAEWRRQNP